MNRKRKQRSRANQLIQKGPEVMKAKMNQQKKDRKLSRKKRRHRIKGIEQNYWKKWDQNLSRKT